MDKKRTIKKILVLKGSYPPEADGSSNRRWAVAVPPSQLSEASKEAFLFMFTVYILFSVVHNKINIGCTGNLEQRLLSHNELGKKG